MEDQVLSFIQKSGLTRIADDITSLLRYTISILQVDSDDNAHMMWGDVGVLYFYIPQPPLITHDFAQVHLIMQCG